MLLVSRKLYCIIVPDVKLEVLTRCCLIPSIVRLLVAVGLGLGPKWIREDVLAHSVFVA